LTKVVQGHSKLLYRWAGRV